ncbi:SUMF1/EgtB/PvdO family nonheme iron enzyme [Rhizobium sp. RHZ01]|uniref:SUMF1/EgtB/PvdO family nonheme iron enzyme n=1 Tax=Rhizobium sp. RHZ01 TaxID=2769304 RepID=UPI0017833A0D|nr:SUMF1/EgtB/PvdO family nonheme iron enzyme [Rhizobium sp. RHZ01]MBD9446234.1 SUMF1/EgtB/PvdO family nonheme iron enzyme [Rhizobium sp. RHZ01]
MNRHAETGSVSGISIAIPLALLAALSGAVAVKAGFASSGQHDGGVTAPEVVTIQPHSFEYREATEYFRKGLAVDAPKHDAKVRLPLDVMKFQTSRAEYQRCVLDGACAPAEYEGQAGPDLPVTGVSYDDAVQYAAWLSQRTGENWRLPSDFELAYAAADRFPDDALGIDDDDTNPATRWLADYEREARRAASTNPKPQPRGSFGISTTGLVDFAGNIWEWTSTCNRRVDLDKAAETEALDPAGCGIIIASGKHRSPMSSFVRNPKGGGCAVGAPPDNLGFRLVRRPTFFQSVVAFARRAATDALGPHISAQTEQNENEG